MPPTATSTTPSTYAMEKKDLEGRRGAGRCNGLILCIVPVWFGSTSLCEVFPQFCRFPTFHMSVLTHTLGSLFHVSGHPQLQAGPAHFVMLNSYMPFNKSSDQYQWLLQDLKKVKRAHTRACGVCVRVCLCLCVR